MLNMKFGRYKVRKEPSPAKRCEKSGKDAKRAVLWKKNRLCYIELDFDRTDVIIPSHNKVVEGI